MAYDKSIIDGFQFMWGKGFLSPGGPEEVREILRGHDIRGLRVLDIGSGLGGIDLLLLREHGAAQVTGIDVDAALVAAATDFAATEGFAGRVDFQAVMPGPLPFAGATFDIVFSKDSMVHIEDKASAYREIFRVLKDGGRFLASDWLWAKDAATSPPVRAWLDHNPLNFAMTTPAEAETALRAAGFADVTLCNRNPAIRESNRELLRNLDGAQFVQLAALIGADAARARLEGTRGRQGALDSGDLLPTHLNACKPK